MLKTSMVRHKIVRAQYAEQMTNPKAVQLRVKVNGKFTIPKNYTTHPNVVVHLQLVIGDEKEQLYLHFHSATLFHVDSCDEPKITESMIRAQCLPIALKELRGSVRAVTVAYGLPPLELPPLDGENPIPQV